LVTRAATTELKRKPNLKGWMTWLLRNEKGNDICIENSKAVEQLQSSYINYKLRLLVF
jgi:hypothetical protein